MVKVLTHQWNLLEEQGRESKNIHKTMIKDLTNTINKIQSPCHQVILPIKVYLIPSRTYWDDKSHY